MHAAARCDAALMRVLHANARGAADKRDVHRLGNRFQRRPADQNLQSRGIRRIADERIGEPQRDRIDRAGRRHADIGKAVAAEVLHGRVQARRFHAQNGDHAATMVNGTS